ncbi:hypothetical protein [Desulfonatronum sp. SC1]|uniref:hypothetical protein n=1 Tax=Desulfonatronum sp. SC1 TaxID=2109626 RepID=UPI000D31438C|nr:hypothetical protein [Desulfonatronum sp. SC1]PTN38674.1 hypothetical protein C6366_01690 [Desulfonatronum sp. SC1]
MFSRAHLASFSVLLLCVLAFLPFQGKADEPSEVLVRGIGYPPVRAESGSQALFMARRAALLDAYRNALNTESEAAPESDRYFQNVAGFLRDVRIVDEAYLDDGAVLMTVAVKKVRSLSSGFATATKPGLNSAAPRVVPGPSSISLDEWMKIISRLVRFDIPQNVAPTTVEEQ